MLKLMAAEVAELMPDYGLDGRVSIPGREKGFLCWL
jgi:hypothetical protein